MDATSLQKRRGYLVVGASGLVLAAGYLGIALQLPFGELARPGAGVFPVVVGGLLALASLSAVWEGWRTDVGEHIDLPAGQDRLRLLVLLGALLLYILLLPWLGQLVASTLFLVLLMRVMSEASWPRIVAYALAISVTLYAVFVRLLNVPMPRGIVDV